MVMVLKLFALPFKTKLRNQAVLKTNFYNALR